jgi:hypothetical protein
MRRSCHVAAAPWPDPLVTSGNLGNSHRTSGVLLFDVPVGSFSEAILGKADNATPTLLLARER